MNGASESYGAPFADDEDSRPTIQIIDGPGLAAELPPLSYLVAEIGLVDGGGAPHLLAGYGFSGKTVAAQAMALSLAAGRAVWGAYKVAPRRVLHVDMEQGDRLTRRRYQRLAFGMGLDLHELGDAIALAVMPAIKLSAQYVTQWRDIMAGRDLVIIDSLRAASGGQDENSSEIRSGLDMLGHVSELTKCRAIVIHHARKQGPDDPGGRFAIRGSSAIYDSADSAYLFGAAKGEPIAVEHVKARSHGEPVEDFVLTIKDVCSEDGQDHKAGLALQVHGKELVQERRDAKASEDRKGRARVDAAAVRAVLGLHPGVGTRELRAMAGLSGDRLAAAVACMGKGVEVRLESNGVGRVARHFLTGCGGCG